MSGIEVHSSAVVSDKAQLGNDVKIGAYSIVEEDVEIGDGTEIASQALVASGARIGKNVRIHHGAVVATIPQDLKFGGEDSLLYVGDNTTIREFATLNRGTEWRGFTKVGSNCLLMAYSHVAHDCLLGDNVILANSVNLAGHVEIHDWAILGGLVPVHQFVKIGAHSMVGGGFRVPMDICPYVLCAGYPLKVAGLNRVGLERRNFSQEIIKKLEKAFRILFRSKLNTTQALERVKSEIEMVDEVKLLTDFIESSERGICK